MALFSVASAIPTMAYAPVGCVGLGCGMGYGIAVPKAVVGPTIRFGGYSLTTHSSSGPSINIITKLH